MSDIHLDARREAERHYVNAAHDRDPNIEQSDRWEELVIMYESDNIEAYATGYVKGSAEKDKVIEGRDALIARIEQHLKYAKCQTCGGSRKVATPPNENGDRGYRTNIEPCTTCADREELMAAISSLAPTGTR